MYFFPIIVIQEHYTDLVRAISTELPYFLASFVKNKFVAAGAAANIRTTYGTGNEEKATNLLQNATTSLKYAADKKGWLSKFISIFSSEPACKDLAASMMKQCQLGR